MFGNACFGNPISAPLQPACFRRTICARRQRRNRLADRTAALCGRQARDRKDRARQRFLRQRIPLHDPDFAVHPVVFGDRMDLPASPFIVGETRDSDVRIVIGGKTEREFCAVREYLTKTASADRMIDFMNSLEGETDFDAVKIGSLLNRWKNITKSTRGRYDSNSSSFARADLPVHTVQLITSVAATPTYYPTQFDIPSSASTEEVLAHADNLWALNGQLKSGDQSIDRAVLKHVASDYAILRDDIKRSQALREGQEAHL